MHEYEITQNIIKICEDEATKNDSKKVSSITLVIGELSSIFDDCIQMYFDVIAEGTLCHGAKLIFKRINAKLQCTKCNVIFEKNREFNCPNCNGMGVTTEIGKEFYIESIEVE